MRITVKLFAVLRDQAGVSELSIEMPSGATVGDTIELLIARYPALRASAARSAVAVNLAYATRDAALNDGDELALIPPVSGGTGPEGTTNA